MTMLVLLALILAVLALVRAAGAERRAGELERRLAGLEARLRAERGAEGAAPDLAPGPQAAPLPGRPLGREAPESASAPPAGVWPEDAPRAPSPLTPAPPAAPRGPSLWGPEYSRARISVIGGLLVLGGLAFTLRAVGAPDWTLLLAVFGFAGLLYFNARRVPWPVSGALRGLGYGVAALGLGSLSQRLTAEWGPGAVLGGLLHLSAALLYDALRRREPLLGALAVYGAAQSTWMLTDDLGRASIPAAGLALLLAAAALWWERRAPEAETAEDEEKERASRAARPLTLLVAGAVPLGWAVASISHVSWGAMEDFPDLLRWVTQVAAVPGALLPWLVFTLLALWVPVALLLAPQGEADRPAHPALTLGAAWATLTPHALAAVAVGAALSGRPLPMSEVLTGGGMALALALTARWAWGAGRGHALGPAVSGALLGGAAGVAGALALSALGGRTAGVALSGIAGALLLVGLYGRSRFWLRVGAAALALVALWTSLEGLEDDLWRSGGGVDALLACLPALLAGAAALRLARDPWASAPPAGQERRPGQLQARLTAPLLGAAAGFLALLPLLPGRPEPLLAAVLLAAAGLPALARWRGWADLLPLALSFGLALAVGTAGLLEDAGAPGEPVWVGVLAALASGAGLYLAFPGAGGPLWRGVAHGAALALVTFGLAHAAGAWWPALGTPGALALGALLAAALPLALGAWRVDALLALGALLLYGDLALRLLNAGPPLPVVGALALLAVWALTRNARGLAALGRAWPLPGDLRPQGASVQSVSAAVLLGLAALALGLWVSPERAWPGLVASSLPALALGLHACIAAQRVKDLAAARAWWITGLALIVAAGLKGALLDASQTPNPAAALGLAVLVTGLSLLAVAILAPRPGREGAGETLGR